ncbi:MAG: helix-turn-helix transcriptional regulator [Clostridiales bacterium]|nr:helix-turn-helix transcriptional regulator [Clostridiales bacterium]
MEKFRERLKELRLEKHLSQHQLAKQVGYGQASIAQWETGARTPSAAVIVALTKFYGCTAGYLLGLED